MSDERDQKIEDLTRENARLRQAVRDFSMHVLEDYIREISEDAHCARWHAGIEFEVWDMLERGDRKIDPDDGPIITEYRERQIRRLREDAGYWPETNTMKEPYNKLGPVWCDLDMFRKRYEAWKANQ